MPLPRKFLQKKILLLNLFLKKSHLCLGMHFRNCKGPPHKTDPTIVFITIIGGVTRDLVWKATQADPRILVCFEFVSLTFIQTVALQIWKFCIDTSTTIDGFATGNNPVEHSSYWCNSEARKRISRPETLAVIFYVVSIKAKRSN